jgi:hypothetical protein
MVKNLLESINLKSAMANARIAIIPAVTVHRSLSRSVRCVKEFSVQLRVGHGSGTQTVQFQLACDVGKR